MMKTLNCVLRFRNGPGLKATGSLAASLLSADKHKLPMYPEAISKGIE